MWVSVSEIRVKMEEAKDLGLVRDLTRMLLHCSGNILQGTAQEDSLNATEREEVRHLLEVWCINIGHVIYNKKLLGATTNRRLKASSLKTFWDEYKLHGSKCCASVLFCFSVTAKRIYSCQRQFIPFTKGSNLLQRLQGQVIPACLPLTSSHYS